MAESGSDPPQGTDLRSADLGMILKTATAARDFMDREVTTFNQVVETREPVGPGKGSGVDTHDANETDDVTVFKYFNQFPAEIRSMIWVAAAEAAKPCGIYHFTFKFMLRRPGPRLPNVINTGLSRLFRIPPSNALSRSIYSWFMWELLGRPTHTFTPSATVAKMTRAIRDLFRSCYEARTELMRRSNLSSSFVFHYLKGGKCKLGTIRPFLYDTDWISIDGMDDPSTPIYSGLSTSDISRVQHFALPYDGFDAPGLFDRGGPFHAGGCLGAARIFRFLDGLKSVGLYAPSFTIKRAKNWDEVITQNDRLFLKCLPAPTSGPVSTRSWSATEYNEAMKKLQDLLELMGLLEMQKTKERWRASTCDFGSLQFCFIIHANNKKGLDLIKFREDGSHLDGVDLDDLGKIGTLLKWLPRAGDNYR